MAFPFHGWLRYAGGKRSIAGLITERLAVRDAFTSACVGGGSVEVQIATAHRLSYLCLADRNPAVRSFHRHGIDELSAPFYARLPFAVLRDRLNEAVAKVESGDASAEGELAVLFWAYSRRCNNGIVRVNREGRFNVSEGLTAQAQPLTVSDFDIAFAAHLGGLIRKAQPRILSCAFEAIESAPAGSSILVDPPYTGGFVSYTKERWGEADDERLFEALAKSRTDKKTRGVLCQPDSPLARELAGRLLPGWHIDAVPMRRSVNSDGQGRKSVGELLIWSGE